MKLCVFTSSKKRNVTLVARHVSLNYATILYDAPPLLEKAPAYAYRDELVISRIEIDPCFSQL